MNKKYYISNRGLFHMKYFYIGTLFSNKCIVYSSYKQSRRGAENPQQSRQASQIE